MHQSNRSFYLELSLDRQNWPVQYAYIYQNCSYNSGMYHDYPVGYVPELFLQFLYVRIVGTILILNEFEFRLTHGFRVGSVTCLRTEMNVARRQYWRSLKELTCLDHRDDLSSSSCGDTPFGRHSSPCVNP